VAAYLFQAKTEDGKVVRGEVNADNETEARVRLKAQKLVPLKIVPKAGGGKGKAKAKSGFSFSFGGGVSAKELQVFTRQFATLIGAGVPVVQSLEAMIGPGRSPVLNNALKDIMQNVSQGRRLAEAMRLHPKIFDNMYVNLVHAGEEGGVLDTVLNRLATYIEKSVKLRGKIKGAMFYPAAVIAVAALVVSGIMWFVIPNFVKIFKDSGMELPWLTQQVIQFSDFFKSKWYIIVGGMAGIPISIKTYYGTEDGRKTLDQVLISLPVMGELVRKGAVARFARTLSTMLSAGVRIIDALDIAASTTQNYVVESVLLKAKESISKGRNLSEPIRASGVIPDMVGQMIAVGEQTGALDTMMDKVANFYEEEVEAAAGALTSMLEPLMMIVLGGIIAVLVIAMYLPIFNMAGAAG
jgi:type IV pilus assembly protein PilC